MCNLKYDVIRTDTADSLIRKIILYVAENFGNKVAEEKLDEDSKQVIVYAVTDQRQDYLSIIRGL